MEKLEELLSKLPEEFEGRDEVVAGFKDLAEGFLAKTNELSDGINQRDTQLLKLKADLYTHMTRTPPDKEVEKQGEPESKKPLSIDDLFDYS